MFPGGKVGKYLTTEEVAAVRDFIFRVAKRERKVDPWFDFPHFLDNEEGNKQRIKFFEKLGLGFLANHVKHVMNPLPGEVLIGKSIIRPLGGENREGARHERAGHCEGDEPYHGEEGQAVP
jgi:hypothetical protein